MAADEAVRTGIAEPKAPRIPRSRRQIEIVVSRSSAIFGLVFAVQTIPFVLQQASWMPPAWFVIVDLSVFGGLLAAVVAAFGSFDRRWIRAVNGYVAFSWLFAMSTWALAVTDPTSVAAGRPWPWYLCTVATAAAAIAWPVWAATVALVLMPLVYGIIRVTPSGGQAPIGLASLDVVYAIILGGAVLIIITLMRGAAASVDLAQSTALARYSNAVGQHATEVERVQVDAIVHDSVLTTLLMAARAYTPEAEALSVRMAVNAMGHLRDAAVSSPDGQATVPFSELASRVLEDASTIGVPFDVRAVDVSDGEMPAQAAEAVHSAAVQAMVNSVQHAGSRPGVARWVGIRNTVGGGVAVEVGDTGAGFDVDAVPIVRIGLRVSILERVANAGGEVEVDSAPGEGTVITIGWPRGWRGSPGAPGAERTSSSRGTGVVT